MGGGYTKLFSGIVLSSVWAYDDQTRIVWLTMLALADKDGEVQTSVSGLAHVARVPLDATRRALEIFLSPDPDSSTKGDDGRRIDVIDRGWRLLNHAKFRRMMTREEKKSRDAERASERRKTDSVVVPTESPIVANEATKSDARDSPASASASASVSLPLESDPDPEAFGATHVLGAWQRSRVAEVGGLEWVAKSGISPPKLREAVELIRATVGSGSYLERSMREFWARVKRGEQPEAERISQHNAFAFACWFARFPTDIERLSGAAPALERPAARDPTAPYCDFHRSARNNNKPSFRPRDGCPECKHVKAMSGSRVSDVYREEDDPMVSAIRRKRGRLQQDNSSQSTNGAGPVAPGDAGVDAPERGAG